ncbi:MAG: hypothetical protein L3J69_10255 [Desulfobacula sp.]|nr:hypothetical protein [Desulfobacula sp.]
MREFIIQSCKELNIDLVNIDPAARGYLSRLKWPENVRELLNYIRRLAVFSNGKKIDLSLIKLIEGENDTSFASHKPDHTSYKDAKREVLDNFSKDYLDNIFKTTHGNISETSRISGLERASIQKIIKRLDIDIAAYRK